MKKTTYIVSNGLFYSSCVFFVFVFIFSILAFVKYTFQWNVPFVEIVQQNAIDYVYIKFPLIEMRVEFILNFLVVITMWIGILFYVIYFYTLKDFFKVFVEENVFIFKSLKRLKIFFYINLTPLIYVSIFTIYQIIKTKSFKFEEDQGIALFHLLVAFLVYLYMDLLKKGKVLQDENDLTI